jgi:transcriptional regulator with XRE-family HTH domain
MAELSLTLEAVAGRVRQVSRGNARPTAALVHHWRRGQVTPSRSTVRWLASALDVDLLVLASAAEAQRSKEDVERRRFVAGAAAAAITPVVTAELLFKGFSAAIGERPSLDDWQEKVEVYGQDYMSLGAAQLQPRLAADLVVLQAQLGSPERWALASKLLALYAKTTPGAGNSSRWYRLAADAADRSDDLTTRVWVRGRAALALAYEGAALSTAKCLAAEALALSDEPSLGRLNAVTAMAHVLASWGDRTGAYRMLDDARWVFDAAGSDEQISDYAVPEWRFHTFASMLLSRMGDERGAVREQDAADRSRPASLARFATHIEMHRGLMLVRAGDVTSGAEYARAAMARLPADRHSLTLRLLAAEVERAAGTQAAD